MKKHVFAMLAAVAMAGGAQAQEYFLYYPHTGEKVAAKDIPVPSAKALAEKTTWKGAGGLTVNFIYSDPANLGWNETTVGATRKATLQAVFAYVDSVLNHVATIDVVCQVSDFNASGALGSAGSLYEVGDGFFDAISKEHIVTGVDPVPGAGFEDIFITMDFGYTWNNGLGAPAISEFDLFTVLLHEVTHGLGFASLAQASGASQYSSEPPPNKAFTKWDNLLFRTSGAAKLWSGVSPNYVGGTLAGGDNTLDFRGTNTQTSFGSFPPIYSPNPFQSGSSISHWQLIAPIPSNAVMRPAVAAGVSNRAYLPFEIQTLRDLGYTVNVTAVPDWNLY